MIWSKAKQQLESFLCPSLVGRVEYIASGYRYVADKPSHCNITVDKKEVFNSGDKTTLMRWYQMEQDIKNDTTYNWLVTPEDMERVKKELGDRVPEDRLATIARNNKASQYSKTIYKAQSQLSKQDFQSIAGVFLSESLDKSLESDDILLNVLALVDRRLGKKRLQTLEKEMQMKHPVVRYFYDLRRRG